MKIDLTLQEKRTVADCVAERFGRLGERLGDTAEPFEHRRKAKTERAVAASVLKKLKVRKPPER